MSLSGLLNQTISLAAKSGLDKYGRETTSAATSVKCRFQKTTKQKMLPNGTLIQIEAVCYIDPDTTININDKVTIDSVDYKVYGKYQAVDGNGHTNHYKLDLTKWV